MSSIFKTGLPQKSKNANLREFTEGKFTSKIQGLKTNSYFKRSKNIILVKFYDKITQNENRDKN
ncbi:MAG: hypothetical protein LIP05_05495 [Tannerellaceae bacterium]|nr:hypothetical protein [Tannerellaceae bacterium]